MNGRMQEVREYTPEAEIILAAYDKNAGTKTIEEQLKDFLNFLNLRIEGYRYELKKCNLYSDTADLVKEKLTEAEAIKRAFHYRLRIKDIKNQHHGLD